MNPIPLSISRCGSPEHRSDLARLASAGIPVPHEYASWCLHESAAQWYWCRAEDSTFPHPVGFAVRLERSRALPWTRIGQVPRVGRALHAPALAKLGDMLATIARRIPRLQRLDVQVFDEDPDRRHHAERSILGAGGMATGPSRSYSHTLVIPLPPGGDDVLLAALRPAARRRVLKVQRSAGVQVRPVTNPAHLDRVSALYQEAFARTGATPPTLRFRDVLRDADSGRSVLLGTFLPGRSAPEGLVAFLWCRLHGDHVTYDTAGSERSDALHGVPVSYPLVWEMLRWGVAHGAHWADLGGVMPAEESAEHPTAGISGFKRRFSDLEKEVASEYRFEPHPLITQSAEVVRRLVRWSRGIMPSPRPSPARGRGR